MLYLPLIDRAGGLYERILTEIVKYRPNAVKSALTTEVKIFPYRPPARLLVRKVNETRPTSIWFCFQVLEPVSVDYDQVFGDMQSAAGDEGGDQKAIQLAGAASSVLNAKAGSGGNDSAAAGERAAVRTT